MRAVLALLGLSCAVLLRSQLAGVAGAASMPGGLAFAVALTGLAVALGLRRERTSVRPVAVGLVGAGVLLVPTVLQRAGPLAARPGFLGWGAVVAAVAVAEEIFFRGALFDLVAGSRGPAVALAVTSVAFGLVHAPLYGWHAVPLDVAVGVWLGALRMLTGTVTAPAVAHVGADLAWWWLG